MDMSTVKGRKITPEERKRRREGELSVCCGNSRHFAASCPRTLKAVSGQVEVTPFRVAGKEKELEKAVEKEIESGKD
jgi:hypothetical protein